MEHSSSIIFVELPASVLKTPLDVVTVAEEALALLADHDGLVIPHGMNLDGSTSHRTPELVGGPFKNHIDHSLLRSSWSY